LEVSGLFFMEAWNFNGRTKDNVGGAAAAASFAVRDGFAVGVELMAARIGQRTSNAVIGSASLLLRRRIATRGDTVFFVDGTLGASDATVPVPERGTRFNYVLQAGGGFSRPVGRRCDLLVDLRWFHLSNNSLNGRDHNPDIEALGGRAGLVVRF
jgi:hypothetical protein